MLQIIGALGDVAKDIRDRREEDFSELMERVKETAEAIGVVQKEK